MLGGPPHMLFMYSPFVGSSGMLKCTSVSTLFLKSIEPSVFGPAAAKRRSSSAVVVGAEEDGLGVSSAVRRHGAEIVAFTTGPIVARRPGCRER